MSKGSTSTVEGPLKGLRVLDAGQMIAGPFACTLLADFGADVIKVEHPVYGDAMRTQPPEKNGLSLSWKVLARNKRNITLNLSTPEGQNLLKRLVPTADVLVENYRPGTFERWGLHYEALSAVNPRLILVRVSGYGQTGPYRNRGGYGTVAEAFCGIPSFTGFPDKPPTLSSSIALADNVAGTFAAMATMFAIYERDQSKSRKGQEIDVSLYEPLFRLTMTQTINYDQLNLVRKRIGNRSKTDSPRNAYETRDGRYITISASTQKSFVRLVEAMGLSELAQDERFTDGFRRQQNADELDQLMAQWFLKHDFADALRIFEEGEVVAGPVYTIEDIFKDPHYKARESIAAVEDGDFGTLKMQNVAPRMLRTPGKIRHAGKALGADNEEIYLGELGLSRQEFDHLRSQKVI